MGFLDPAKVISEYASTMGVEKLTKIFIKMREQIDPNTLIEIDEAWNLSKRDPDTGKYYCVADGKEEPNHG